MDRRAAAAATRHLGAMRIPVSTASVILHCPHIPHKLPSTVRGHGGEILIGSSIVRREERQWKKRGEKHMQVRLEMKRKARSGSHDVVRDNAKPYEFAFLTAALSPNILATSILQHHGRNN